MTYALAQIRDFLLLLLDQVREAPNLATIRAYFEGIEPPDRIGRLIQQLRQDSLIAAEARPGDRPVYEYRLTRMGKVAADKIEIRKLPPAITLRLNIPDFPHATLEEKTDPELQDNNADNIAPDAPALTMAQRRRIGACQMNPAHAQEIIDTLRRADDPLAPREILPRVNFTQTSKTLRSYLQRLCRAGSIIGAGRTASRFYTVPERKSELLALTGAPPEPAKAPPTDADHTARANEIIQLLREADQPLQPAEILHRAEHVTTRDLLSYYLRRLRDSGKIVGRGHTASRRYTTADRAHELEPWNAPDNRPPATPPTENPSVPAAGNGQNDTITQVLRDNAKAADAALWRYIESAVDPDIYDALKHQSEAAHRALDHHQNGAKS